ncbi:protein kinase, partial [Acidobacteriota bacterium]
MEDRSDTLSLDPADISFEQLASFSPGYMFSGRYRIIEEIGRGGMGRVYKAEDTDLGITVALKVIRPKYSSDSRFIRRFKKELLTARSISQENIIRIFDMGQDQGIRFISMEYIKGQSLKELIQTSDSLTIPKALELTKQICYALQAAHRTGIIHRDLKPSNIMVDRKGQAFVMDFGIAQSIYGSKIDKSKTFLGTPKYISPEQAKGEELDTRSDIYALGLTMFEMLTGRAVFESETKEEYVEKHKNVEPPSPSKFNPDVPTELERLILKCLIKNRDERIQDVSEVLKEIAAYEKKLKKPTVRQPSKNKFLTVYGPMALGLILVIYIVLQIIERFRPPPFDRSEKLPIAVLYFENTRDDYDFDNLGKSLAHWIIQDLEQSKIIRPVSSDKLLHLLDQLELGAVQQYTLSQISSIASAAKVNLVLHGSFTSVSGKIEVNANIIDIDLNRNLGHISVTGLQSDIPSLVDHITRILKGKLGISEAQIASDLDRNVANISTKSTLAYNLYLDAKEHSLNRDYPGANELLFKALKEDPDFAMALWQVSVNYEYSGKLKESLEYLERALNLIDSLPEREKYLLRAHQAYKYNSTPQEAITIYSELLGIYPDDVNGHTRLGSIYRNLENWDQAAYHFECALELEQNDELIYLNLASIHAAKGLFDKGRELLMANSHVFDSPSRYQQRMCLMYIREGKLELAHRELALALQFDQHDLENKMLFGILCHLEDNFSKAKNVYLELIKCDDQKQSIRACYNLVQLYMEYGLFHECREQIEFGLADASAASNQLYILNFLIDRAYLNLQFEEWSQALADAQQTESLAREFARPVHEKWAVFLQALAQAFSGDFSSAEGTAEGLRDLIDETESEQHMRLYFYLRGAIAEQRGEL